MEAITPEREARLATLPPETRQVLLKKPLPEKIEDLLIARYANAEAPVEQRLAVLWLLKARGWTVREIASQFGVRHSTVLLILKQARERGVLMPIESQFQHDIAQLSADIIQEALVSNDPDLAPGMAITVAKGLGQLKSHQAIKSESKHEGSMVLGLKLEVPEGVAPRPIGSGTTIAGTPRQLTPAPETIDGTASSIPQEQE